MNRQTEEKHGITRDKLHLTKLFRKVMFVRMLCSPIFILVYWYFCRTLYKFCMYGGVKKRGSILAVCVIFFLAYLIYYYIRVRKIKVAENMPEKINIVKWYGFSKDSFYCVDKDNFFWIKQCNDEDKDYLRLKYSELPKYKHFFWKIPAYLILLMITVITICGVIKSGTNLNGKLAWYLFDLRHTSIVAEQQEESCTEQEDSTITIQEIVGETTEEVGSVQEESSNNENGVVDEIVISRANIEVEEPVYRDLITEMLDTGKFPAGGSEWYGNPYDNYYGIADVDLDGQDELVIYFPNGFTMAAMAYYVYDYDRTIGEPYIQCSGFPDFTIYDNGYIIEMASHNHGRSNLDDFWPYRVLKYNEQTDTYECIANMDAWQQEYNSGNSEFPEEKDVDGDGVVYYNWTAEEWDNPSLVMDNAEYEMWYQEITEGNVIEITKHPIITKEEYYELYPQPEANG